MEYSLLSVPDRVKITLMHACSISTGYDVNGDSLTIRPYTYIIYVM